MHLFYCYDLFATKNSYFAMYFSQFFMNEVTLFRVGSAGKQRNYFWNFKIFRISDATITHHLLESTWMHFAD